MTPFHVSEARAVALRLGIVDTDQLIPARFLRRPRSPDHARLLFHDRRFGADGTSLSDSPLNDPRNADAQILVVDGEFGVGSAREQAAWALYEFGFRVVVALRFGDVFRENALRCGILPILLAPSIVTAIMDWLAQQPDGVLRLDLAGQRIDGWPDGPATFDIDPFDKLLLAEGLDEYALTKLQREAHERFDQYYALRFPWFASRLTPGHDGSS